MEYIHLFLLKAFAVFHNLWEKYCWEGILLNPPHSLTQTHKNFLKAYKKQFERRKCSRNSVGAGVNLHMLCAQQPKHGMKATCFNILYLFAIFLFLWMSNTCKLTQTCHSPLTLSQVIPPAVNLKQNCCPSMPPWSTCNFKNSHVSSFIFKNGKYSFEICEGNQSQVFLLLIALAFPYWRTAIYPPFHKIPLCGWSFFKKNGVISFYTTPMGLPCLH